MNDDRERCERRVGATLAGKWTLESLLGIGGMAAVYVGVHKIGRRDAIKILHDDLALSKDLRSRFEREAHAANRFRHPGAVAVLDVDVTEDGAPFLVMELLDGEPLSTRAKRDAVSIDDALRFADELLDVLMSAHAHGIVHRDVKPDNLFVMRDGRLKVLDFGIARMREGAPRTMQTKEGVTIGTLSYMPPEQVAGKEIDGRADLFAVGCTLFELVSRKHPHHGGNDLELLVKMAFEPAPPLSVAAPSADAELCKVVDRALAFDRDRRYPDAATMQVDIRALRAGKAPPWASARLIAGDLPNPPKVARTVVEGAGGAGASNATAAMTVMPSGGASNATAAMTVMPSGGASNATAAMTVMPSGAVPSGAVPSMAVPSMAVPSMAVPTVAVPNRPAPSMAVPTVAVPTVPVAAHAMQPPMSVAGMSLARQAPFVAPDVDRDRRTREVLIAVAAVLTACLLVVIVVVARGRREQPLEDAPAASADPSADPLAADAPEPTTPVGPSLGPGLARKPAPGQGAAPAQKPSSDPKPQGDPKPASDPKPQGDPKPASDPKPANDPRQPGADPRPGNDPGNPFFPGPRKGAGPPDSPGHGKGHGKGKHKKRGDD